jgi:peptidoglycan hydrolase-like protein with peptidoglycan-binding domain
MSNLTDIAPRRLPEWLSLPDISRAWKEETGEDAAAFEEVFRTWFKEYLVRNAYGDAGGEGEGARNSARLLEGGQIWREIFEAFCEERGLAKPRFWFPGGDRATAEPRYAISEPVSITEPASITEPVSIADAEADQFVGEAATSANRDHGRLFRRHAREGGGSFTWIAAGLVTVVVAGLVSLGLQDLEAPVADADIVSGPAPEMETAMTAPTSVDPTLAYLLPEGPVPAQTGPAQTGPAQTRPAVTANADSGVNDPPLTAAIGEVATPAPEAPAADQVVSRQSADQGLVLLLQREFQVAGYDPGPLDGASGPKFAAAVATYQRANGMHVDGHASTELLSRLARDNLDTGRTAAPGLEAAPLSGLAAMPSAETRQDATSGRTAGLESGATLQLPAPIQAPAPTGRELVRAVQKRLSDRRYYEGPLDGNLGPKTRQAIQVYQRVQRYQTTGQPSRALYEELEDYALDAQGLSLFRKGSYDAAIATYTQIIQRNPNSADAYFNRGLAHKNLGRTDQALSDYGTALALDPAHRRAYLNRANILYDQGLYVAAVRDYFKVLKLLLSFS